MAVEFRQEHRREALIATVLLHVLLLLLFFFIKFRNPPEDLELLTSDGGGMELNYGLDAAGSGDIQTTAPANNSPNREDSRPPARMPDPEPMQARPEPVQAAAAQEKVVTSDVEETAVVRSAPKTVEKPREEPKEDPEPPKPQPQVNQRAVFTPRGATANTGGNGTSGTSSAPAGNNNGDRPGTVGDQGSPDGTLNGRALYGNGGSGGGTGGGTGIGDGLDMSGWAFDDRPRPQMIGNENGYARFKIKISEEGEVEAVTKVSGNVSAAQVQACINEINRTASFKRTRPGTGGATGFITFTFKTQ